MKEEQKSSLDLSVFLTSKTSVSVFPAITMQSTIPKECALSKLITVI